MASPIVIGGVQVLAPDQGDTYLWGAAIKSALAQVAATCLQTTGGTFPLTAELNLGSNFGLAALYFRTATALPAAGGVFRLAAADSLNFRNVANSGDNTLTIGSAGGLTDVPLWTKFGGSAGIIGNAGRAYAEYTTIAGQSIPNNTATTINFGTQVVDTDNAVATGAGWTFTVPTGKGGRYLVDVAYSYGSAIAVTTAMQTNVVVNGVSLLSMYWQISSGTGSWVANNIFASTKVVNIAAGQTIYAQAFQTSGGAVSLSAVVASRIAICGPL